MVPLCMFHQSNQWYNHTPYVVLQIQRNCVDKTTNSEFCPYCCWFIQVPKIPLHNISQWICCCCQTTYIAKWNTCIGGFNCDYHRASHIIENALTQSLQISYLKQVIHEITTDYNTTIDFIFTSKQTNFIAVALESYTSDHKPIFISYET